MRQFCQILLAGVAVAAFCGVGYADLSIYDVQYTTDASGDSPYDGQIQNVAGGVVTHVWSGFNDRVYLQDPAHPTWGAICVKDWTGSLVSAVQVGDWLSFDQIKVEDHRGTTFLQYDPAAAPDVAYTIESTGNPVPAPTVLNAADLPAPLEGPPGQWYVADHSSEAYESMVVTLENVTVGAMDLGKAEDNYELLQGSDLAWGADYMNVDAGAPYHWRVYPGAELDSITGIVEQYTKLTSGWDYYQLLTRSTADIVPEPGSLALLIVAAARLRRR